MTAPLARRTVVQGALAAGALLGLPSLAVLQEPRRR